MAKYSKPPSSGWIVFVAIAGLVLFALTQVKGLWTGLGKLFTNFGLAKDPVVAAVEEEANKAGVGMVASGSAQVKQQYEKQASTKTDKEWLSIAETIFEELRHSSVSDDYEDAGYQICRVQNQTDVYKLIDAFGYKPRAWFGIPTGSYTLPTYAAKEFSADKIKAINNNYKSKGITFRY